MLTEAVYGVDLCFVTALVLKSRAYDPTSDLADKQMSWGCFIVKVLLTDLVQK